MIYLDNAATSFPKPDDVPTAVDEQLRHGGNAARGHHRLAGQGERLLRDTRAALASFFHAPEPSSIVFTFNATDGLNMAIKGFVQPGDHVVTTALEHNSVTRPLNGLVERGGVELTVVDVEPSGLLDPERVVAALRTDTRLMVLTHVSNVLGTVQPVAVITQYCHDRGVAVLLDAAQSAGELPIDVQALGVDMMAFPGHKGLLAPQGIGGLYVRPGVELRSWREGGTGTDSESPRQPLTMPDRLEAGTQNLPAIAGLGAGLKHLQQHGFERPRRLVQRLIEELPPLKGVTVHGDIDPSRHAAVLSFNIDGLPCADAGMILDESFGIAVRTGLHCAPGTHRTIGTFPEGSIRVSPGWGTSDDEIDAFLQAVEQLATSIQE